MLKRQFFVVIIGFGTALVLVFSSPASQSMNGKSIIASVVLVATVLLAYKLPAIQRWISKQLLRWHLRIARKGGVR